MPCSLYNFSEHNCLLRHDLQRTTDIITSTNITNNVKIIETGKEIYGSKRTKIREQFVSPFTSSALSIIPSFIKLPVNYYISKTISSPGAFGVN